MANATRKNGRHLRVPVLPEEEAAIKQNAAATGLSVAAYLRNVGLGHLPKGELDQKAVLELLRAERRSRASGRASQDAALK